MQAPEDRLVATLTGVCPTNTDLRSVIARDACARALGEASDLSAMFGDVILWGSQPAGVPIDRALDSANLTEFEPMIWRRLYLSTYAFDGNARVEDHPPYRVVIVPVKFRGGLPDGEYPYPFWHSEEKWLAYQLATELLFVFREGRIVGVMRGLERDTGRALSHREWDGMWRWDEGRQPRVALYSYAFSAENEAVPALDTAYRALEARARASGCESCHAPDNPSKMPRLEILNYPAQALAARRTLVSVLAHDLMPPPEGLGDDTLRAELIDLAQAFVVAADAAIAREKELSGSTDE